MAHLSTTSKGAFGPNSFSRAFLCCSGGWALDTGRPPRHACSNLRFQPIFRMNDPTFGIPAGSTYQTGWRGNQPGGPEL
jgi:hypothetical protein